ncbi:sugar transferase [Lignipirellula cremea]|uniref:UDP-glucose:undecaprenyl-phosphate glucose-1-phosphate transferase n=1 Tax=Lignipirellula cremea TaxID=2528010 RepID=A0A518E4P5_9BACT|nr:sugar transferase [Lignipirellula cremea]QDU99043.1 UDP-glucose:undecaprenyl-phosphate glucose-1-phosphate transferase [Lignipirellula cremea]
MNGAAFAFVKRIFDLVLAIVALSLLWPVLLIVAILVKRSSPGPVFYRGLRTGRFGTPFYIWKFRSMVVDGERVGGTTTAENDPRITRVGLVIRKYKLDELPQLFNVLTGEMSFVGPRPEVAEYTDSYSPDEQRILNVKPGITDWASLEFNDLQSHVGREDADRAFRERVLPRKNQLRLRYVDQQSLWFDFYILVQTFLVVASKPFRRSRT